MYAIIRAGGKQAKVQEGDVIDVERIKAEGEIAFTPLLIVNDDGSVLSDRDALGKLTVMTEVVGDSTGPRSFVLADDEFAGAGARSPVHPPQFVADDVRSQGKELVTAGGQRSDGLLVSRRVVACDRMQRTEVDEFGVDDKRDLVRCPHRTSGETEGVAKAEIERTDVDESSPCGREPVGDRSVRPALDRRKMERCARGATDVIDGE